MYNINQTTQIKALVHEAVESYAIKFKTRHIAQRSNPDGVINMKIHNVFIESLGPEIQFYSALVRSLDSSLGNMLEGLAIKIAGLSFDVHRNVHGKLSKRQTSFIAEILQNYKNHAAPSIADYAPLREDDSDEADLEKQHNSDYYLIDRETNKHYLIELKIGGDLDNKKARSEKEALLEQYAMLSNSLPSGSDIKIFFATAYNRFGEDTPWTQGRVRQFFADDELLIGRGFWDFICQSSDGYATVLTAYRENASLIREAVESIKQTYIGQS